MSKDDVFDYVMESPQDTNPTVLRSLLNGIQEGGGTELPEVDSGDNGMVLGVVEGAWDKMAAPGTPEVVAYYGVYSDGKVYFSSGDTQKTVVDAYKAGKDVQIWVRESGSIGDNDLLLTPDLKIGSGTLVFGGSREKSGVIVAYTCTFTENSTSVIGAGVPAAKASAASSDPFYVTVSWNDPDFIADKTFSEIDTAITAGKQVYCIYGGWTTNLTYFNSTYGCAFVMPGNPGHIVSISNSNEITVDDFSDLIKEIMA